MSAHARLKKPPVPGPFPPSSAGAPRADTIRVALNSGSASSASSSTGASKGKGKAPASANSRDTSTASTPIPEPRLGDDILLSNDELVLSGLERFLDRPVQCPLVIDNVECDAELASNRQLARVSCLMVLGGVAQTDTGNSTSRSTSRDLSDSQRRRDSTSSGMIEIRTFHGTRGCDH